MKKIGVAMTIALLAGWTAPSYAQMPNINLLADGPSKTPEEKEADEARDKAYKETLRKIPDAKSTSDPWGAVRTTDAPKAPAAKAAASTKKTRSGPSTN
jgi:hypothetical protein